MRRAWLFAQMISLCLILAACGGSDDEEMDIQAEYREITGAEISAVVTCHYDEEVREYTLQCSYTPDSSRIEVEQPEQLQGVAATVEGETLEISYDDMILDAGTYSAQQLSPMWVIPSMMRAIREGYPLEYCREDLGENQCLRVTFEVTGEDEEKLYYALWFGEDGLPLRGEITMADIVVYIVEFTDFTKEGWNNGTTTAEDLGGD